MTFENELMFQDPIISKMRTVFVDISESLQIVGNKVLLTELPDSATKVNVTGDGITWIETSNSTPSTNQYHVNYTNGVVTFHPNRDKMTLLFSYKGRGQQFFPASRIYDKVSPVGEVVNTLQNIIDSGEIAIDALEELEVIVESVEQATQEALDAADNANAVTIAFNEAELNRVDAENIRQANEQQRVGNENERKGNELARIADEVVRVSQEESRENAELLREEVENTRKDNEQIRQDNESIRIDSENTREGNELQREQNEMERISSEQARKVVESNRADAEQIREGNENNRKTNELDRVTSEDARNMAEAIRQNQEEQRQIDTTTAINNAEAVTEELEEAIYIVGNTKYIAVWSSTINYKKNNIVGFNGSSFISLVDDNLNNTPNDSVDTDFWGLLARRGVDGEGSVSAVNDIAPDISGNVTLRASDLAAISVSEKAQPNGIATLDENGLVPHEQLPEIEGLVDHGNEWHTKDFIDKAYHVGITPPMNENLLWVDTSEEG